MYILYINRNKYVITGSPSSISNTNPFFNKQKPQIEHKKQQYESDDDTFIPSNNLSKIQNRLNNIPPKPHQSEVKVSENKFSNFINSNKPAAVNSFNGKKVPSTGRDIDLS
jgi:hypothetical protein